MMSCAFRVLLGLALTLLPAIGAAQSAADTARHDVRECWRFGFGAWEPALDWHAAGHTGRTPAEYAAAAARGEIPRPAAPSSNALWSAAAGDTVLLIFPDWWPAGVALRIEQASGGADTLRGTAMAFVADGRRPNPRSRIVAIRRRCG